MQSKRLTSLTSRRWLSPQAFLQGSFLAGRPSMPSMGVTGLGLFKQAPGTPPLLPGWTQGPGNRQTSHGFSTSSFASFACPSSACPAFRSTGSRSRDQTRRAGGSSRSLVVGVVAAIGVIAASDLLASEAAACGIIATVGEDDAVPFLLEGLHILQNRGYDSVGMATSTDHKGDDIRVSKFASRIGTSDCLDILRASAYDEHKEASYGIAHTRWATHGAKTDFNAHPHMDSKQRIALVHNGTIQNFIELKGQLRRQGVEFKSETDTELIAQLVGLALDDGMTVLDALKKSLARLEGTWGIALMHKDHPNQVVAARNGSPLVVGMGDKRMFVASEVAAFSRHTQKYIALRDGEIAVVNMSGVVGLDLARVESAPPEDILLSPAPYPHWTLKEIEEQPEAIQRTLGNGGRFSEGGRMVKLGGLEGNLDNLLTIQNLILTGCGTSLFASRYGQRIMMSLRCFDTVQAWDAAELSSECFPMRAGGLVAVSQSGETKDTHRAVELAQELELPVMSVVNQVGSLIARSTGCGVYLHAGREHAVASTKAFSTQVTALCLMASWFAEKRALANESLKFEHPERHRQLIDSIHRLPLCAGIALNSSKTRETVTRIATRLVKQDTQHIFVLGKGHGEPIACEAALKIKEISYIHAEGFGGGSLKHGPFALLDHDTPVILLILDDPHKELMRIAAQSVKARGTYNIVVTDNPALAEGCAHETIVIPSNGPLTALLGVLPLQLLAYELSCLKGINPDKPKNLAKAVTVD